MIGAIIVGAAVASSNSDNGDNRAQLRREYYEDGYRSGQRDWDDDRAPKYMRYSDRFPRDYENDFAATTTATTTAGTNTDERHL